MAVRILFKKESGIVALALEKAHRENWRVVVVYYADGAREHPYAGYITIEPQDQSGQAVQTHQARVEKD